MGDGGVAWGWSWDGGFAGAMMWQEGVRTSAWPLASPGAHSDLGQHRSTQEGSCCPSPFLLCLLAPCLNGASSVPAYCRQDESLSRNTLTTMLLYNVVTACAHTC